MKKRNGMFKRKNKGDQASEQPVQGEAFLNGEDDEEIIDLNDIIIADKGSGNNLDFLGDDDLTASKLGLDVNLEDIDLDDEIFSEDFDEDQNALLNAVNLDEDDDTDLKDTDLDAEFRALLGEDAEQIEQPDEAAPTEEVTVPEEAAADTGETALFEETVEAEAGEETVAEAMASLDAAELPAAEQELDDELDVLADLEQPAEEQPGQDMPQQGPAAEPAPAMVKPSPAPALDEQLLEDLVDQIEDRLQQAVQRAVAEQLPHIVREILGEELARLKEDLD